jgi:hypothetical protein
MQVGRRSLLYDDRPTFVAHLNFIYTATYISTVLILTVYAASSLILSYRYFLTFFVKFFPTSCRTQLRLPDHFVRNFYLFQFGLFL